MKVRFFIIVLMLSVGLSSGITSCGFHLRGNLDNLSSSSLKGQSVYITSLNDRQMLESDLRHVLNLSNVKLESQPQNANYQIVIVKSSLSRFESGLDTNGRINEYEFIMQLDFVMIDSASILDTDTLRGKTNSEDSLEESEEEKSLKISRHFYFETNDLVGKKTEENTLLKDMRSQLAIQFLQQFSAFNNTVKSTVGEHSKAGNNE